MDYRDILKIINENSSFDDTLIVPFKLLTDSRFKTLRPSAIMVYILLYNAYRKNKQLNIANIEACILCDYKTVRRAIKSLISNDLIKLMEDKETLKAGKIYTIKE